jgi:hypothetical protein
MWTRQQQTKLAKQSTYIFLCTHITCFYAHIYAHIHYIPGMWTRQQQMKSVAQSAS